MAPHGYGLQAPEFHNEPASALRIHIEGSLLLGVNVDLGNHTNRALIRRCLDSVLRLCASVPHLPVTLSLVARLHYTWDQFRFCTRPSFLVLRSVAKVVTFARSDFWGATRATKT